MCDICNRKLDWKEVVIACILPAGIRFVECLNCSEKYPDDQKHEGIYWEVHIFGETLFYESK